jgi:hypothetical protein
MQLLGPPEKEALCFRGPQLKVWPVDMRNPLRTGYHKLRKRFQAFCSRRAIFPVGIHRHLVPKDLCSYEAVKSVLAFVIPTGMQIEETDVQVVSE